MILEMSVRKRIQETIRENEIHQANKEKKGKDSKTKEKEVIQNAN
jgi:hypothetical protein